MTDDLTDYERRLTLGALWDSKRRAMRDLDKYAEGDDDRLHIQEAGESFDNAARKLGGDPTKKMYGAAEY